MIMMNYSYPLMCTCSSEPVTFFAVGFCGELARLAKRAQRWKSSSGRSSSSSSSGPCSELGKGDQLFNFTGLVLVCIEATFCNVQGFLSLFVVY